MAKGAKAKEKPGRRQLGVKLDVDLWRELRILALEKDRTAGELLEEAMGEYLEKHRERKEMRSYSLVILP